jgi:hypothetical protein
MKKIINHFKENWIKYGFETLVIIVGILGAFTLNNWNEYRKLRKTEVQVLTELKVEFISNKNRFDSFSLKHAKREATWLEFLNDISDITSEDKRAVRRPGNGAVGFLMTNSALKSFLNTGKIETISNDSLKNLLVKWGDEVARFNEIQNRHKAFVETELRKFEYSRRILPNLQAGENIIVNPFYKSYSEKEVKRMFLNINSDLGYQNILINNYMWINVRLQRNVMLENKFNEIINLLNDEVSER